MGYLSRDDLGATIFFRLVSARHESALRRLTRNDGITEGFRNKMD